MQLTYGAIKLLYICKKSHNKWLANWQMLSFQFYFITEDHATPPVKVSWWNNTITYLRVQIADTFLSLYSTKLSTDWCVHGKRTYFTIYFSKKYVNCFHSITSCYSLVYFWPQQKYYPQIYSISRQFLYNLQNTTMAATTKIEMMYH